MMQSKINSKFIAIILLGMAIFSSCEKLRYKEEKKIKIFRFNSTEGISSLDPIHAETEANINAVAQLYNGLFEFTEDLKLVPCLAESYNISPDGKTYTIKLKQGVFFHSNPVFAEGQGREVRANDVIYSFKRLLSPKSGSTGTWVLQDRVLKNADGSISDTCFVALDDYSLRIHLQEPFMPFLQLLSMPFTYIVPQEAVAKYGDLRKNAVGTGAFIFDEWLEYNYLSMNRNPYYFKKDSLGRQLPLLDRIEVSFLTDEKDAFHALETNKLDFLTSLSSNYINKIINKDGTISTDFSNNYNVIKNPILNTEYVGFQLDTKQYTDNPNHPLLDIRIRQAINYAMDRAEIIDELRRNLGKPATAGIVPPILNTSGSKTVQGYNYNPNKVDELLQAAGYPNGKGMPEITFYTIPSALYLAEYIQAKLRHFGIQVKIEVNNTAGHISMINIGQAKMFRLRWLADYPDAENYLALFNSKNVAPGPNKTRYINPVYDSLYTKACAEKNDTLRQNLYQEMEQIMLNNACIIPIYYDESLQLLQKKVIGRILGGAYNFKLEKIDIKMPK